MGYLPTCLGSLAKSTAPVLSGEGGSISWHMSFHIGLFQEREKKKKTLTEKSHKKKKIRSRTLTEKFLKQKKKGKKKKKGCLQPNHRKNHNRYVVLFRTA